MLTGCGGSKKTNVRCDVKDDDFYARLYFYFTDEKISNTSFVINYIDHDMVDDACSMYKQKFTLKADVSCNRKTGRVYINNFKWKDVLGLNKEEFFEFGENYGFECHRSNQ